MSPPDKKDCYDGPHMDDWLISDCKFINFGVGENENDGDVINHHSLIFTKYNVFQKIPDKVSVRMKMDNFSEYHSNCKDKADFIPLLANKESIPLKKEKIKGLHHMAKLSPKGRGILMNDVQPP